MYTISVTCYYRTSACMHACINNIMTIVVIVSFLSTKHDTSASSTFIGRKIELRFKVDEKIKWFSGEVQLMNTQGSMEFTFHVMVKLFILIIRLLDMLTKYSMMVTCNLLAR